MRTYLTNIVVATGLLSGLATFAHAGEAGKVVFVTGEVSVANRPAKLDTAVQEGDELSTGADGYIYVKTVDQGFLVLRPGSRARIVAYHIDDKNPANTRVKFELLNGVARSISGNGVKHARQNFRFNTPVAAIGVRGTDFVVSTDQQTSRVTVVSGGVVVSGFSGGCGPEGGGPCEGGASRELFAGQSDMMLQVERGQKAPQLLRSPVPSSPAESPTAPARPDEPVGKAAPATTATTSSATTAAAPASSHIAVSAAANIAPSLTANIVTSPTVSTENQSLDAQKTTAVLASSKPVVPVTSLPSVKPPPVVEIPAIVPDPVLPPVTTPPVVVTPPEVVLPPVTTSPPLVGTSPPVVETPVVVTPPVVVVPPVIAEPPVVKPLPPVPPPAPEISWGRYQAAAGLTPDAAMQVKLNSGDYAAPTFIGAYQITRLKATELVMPKEGKASFVLTGSEAIIERNGGLTTVGTVGDAHLDVNFESRTFKTGLTVAGDGLLVPISSSGNITKTGELVNPTLGNTIIKGYLGGPQAGEAAYLFKNMSLPGVVVTGATSWAR